MAAAPAKSGGGGGGAQKISEVDGDRLWRDRVSQELMYQRQWVEEYGFMVDDATRERLRAGSVTAGNVEALLTESTKKGSKFPSTPAVGALMSTQGASYKVLPSPEIKGDPSPYRRRKHPP
jgi:hypothetical protein